MYRSVRVEVCVGSGKDRCAYVCEAYRRGTWVYAHKGKCMWRKEVFTFVCDICCVYCGGVYVNLYILLRGQDSSPDFIYEKCPGSVTKSTQSFRKFSDRVTKIRQHNVLLGLQFDY